MQGLYKMDGFAIIIVAFCTLLGALGIVGAALNIYTRKSTFNTFYRERLAVCASSLLFTVVSSICASPGLVDVKAVHSSEDLAQPRYIAAALGNWVLNSYYFGMNPAYNWCMIYLACLQTKRIQKRIRSADFNLFLASRTSTDKSDQKARMSNQMGNPAGNNICCDIVDVVATADSVDTALSLSDQPLAPSLDLEKDFKKPARFVYILLIAFTGAVISGLLLALVHELHLLAIDSPRRQLKQEETPEHAKPHAALYEGLFTPNLVATIDMGTYSYSAIAVAARVIIVSVFFGLAAAQIRAIENPNKAIRRRGWIKIGLAFAFDALATLLTLTTLLFKDRTRSFTSLMLLLCASASTLVYSGVAPPCVIIAERKAKRYFK